MRIGLVLNILDEQYQISVYQGIKARAEELGIELICMQEEFACITSNLLLKTKQSSNIFNLDGIVLLTSVIADNYIINSKSDVKKIFGDIPVVSAGENVEGVPSVMIQTDESMKQLVEHLILHHKYKKFVYIGGSPRHYDSIVREEIFKKTIEAYKPWIPDLEYVIKYGLFSEHVAIQEMKDYYQENPDADPDVVVCASDSMAVGIYKFFNMNYNNPKIKRCAVTGFDDIPQAKYNIPSLTTINQPLKIIGENAVNQIVNLIQGKAVEDVIYVESKFLIRNSCGCQESIAEWNEPEKFVENLQTKYIKSEMLLKIVSRLAQDLNYNEEEVGLRFVINKTMEELNVKNFCIVTYAEQRDLIRPLYVRRNGVNFLEFAGGKKMTITDFYEKFIYYDETIPLALVLKVLQTNNENFGFVLYDSEEDELPYLWTIATNVSQALMKIKILEERKRYSAYLEEEVKKRTVELIQANNKRLEVEAQVLKISELERQRFSTDLHDDICQRLAGISMLCRSYSRQENLVNRKNMEELTELVSDTLQTTRQYAHSSYPVEIESLGLKNSLSNLCNNYEKQNGIKCNYQWLLDEEYSFTKTQEINIFRIIQEALHNVLKHACAQNVEVMLKDTSKKIIISIKDDGVGFVKKVKKIGLGLNSMQYRANQSGGEFKISKQKTKGTLVSIQFPKEAGEK